jgi:hypothetical protein
LVYVAAFAPDAGQSIGEIRQAFAKPAGADQLQPQPNGFLLLSQEKGIEEDFAQDLTAAEKAHLVAAQPKTSGAIFEAKPTAAAWRAKPAWYVVSSNDRMIDPEQEKSMAKQMKAKTTVIPSTRIRSPRICWLSSRGRESKVAHTHVHRSESIRRERRN